MRRYYLCNPTNSTINIKSQNQAQLQPKKIIDQHNRPQTSQNIQQKSVQQEQEVSKTAFLRFIEKCCKEKLINKTYLNKIKNDVQCFEQTNIPNQKSAPSYLQFQHLFYELLDKNLRSKFKIIQGSEKQDKSFFQQHFEQPKYDLFLCIQEVSQVQLENSLSISSDEGQVHNTQNLNVVKNNFSKESLSITSNKQQRKIITLNKISNALDYNKIMVGLPNLNNTCYINASIQALRQIYYFNKTCFQQSKFGQHLQQLFQNMEENKSVNSILQNIRNILTRQSRDDNGGDAYLSLMTLIQEIKDSFNKSYLAEFAKTFDLNYSDVLVCKKCRKYDLFQDTSMEVEEQCEIGIEVNNLMEIFDQPTVFAQDKIKCKQCGIQDHFYERIYQNTPFFLIVRVLTNNQKPQQQLQQQIFKLVLQDQICQYKIIGLCNYYSNHFTYKGLYGEKWVEFNDSQAYQNNNNSVKNVFYYILQKI